jgi:hypothetical protein
MFHHRPRNGKAIGFALRVIMGVTFFNIMTFFADKKFG